MASARKLVDPQGEAAGGGGAPHEPEPLYAPRVKIFPKVVTGTFRRLKWWALGVLLGIYWLAPWLRWDRGPGAPDQAILIDMNQGRAYFFFIEIWPQEVYYITGLLILAAVGLFLITALFGRLWCGYACPQTVWTDLFMLVERKIQGDRNARMKLDKAPWGAQKLLKVGATHLVWLLIAAATGGAFVQYFINAPTAVHHIFLGEASTAMYLTIAFLTGTTYLLAGWAREQVCCYMCPWPRFQSAMLDDESMVVTYEAWRGEPRGPLKRKKKLVEDGAVPEVGHCIDCMACVHVCPTGIDIRDGMQMECIGCGLCIDACNATMDKVGFPRDLVRFDSVQNTALRAEGRPAAARWLRPRTVFYAALIALVAAVMLVALANRDTLEINVLRDRNPLFVPLSDGSIRNGYTVKLLNMEREEKLYLLGSRGIDGAQINVIGAKLGPDGRARLPVAPDQVGSFRVYIAAPRAALSGGSMPLELTIEDSVSGAVETYDTIFVGPDA